MIGRILIATGAVLMSVQLVQAEETPKDAARYAVLDACVIATATKANSFTKFVDTCRCASEKAVEDLSPAQHKKVFRTGSLSFGSAGAWRRYMKECKGDE